MCSECRVNLRKLNYLHGIKSRHKSLHFITGSGFGYEQHTLIALNTTFVGERGGRRRGPVGAVALCSDAAGYSGRPTRLQAVAGRVSLPHTP